MTGAAPLRVLYLDDDEQYAHLFKAMTERLGYQTITYCVASAALESLAAPGAPYDLFVTDFHMPGINGLEVVRRARACRACVARSCPAIWPPSMKGMPNSPAPAGSSASPRRPSSSGNSWSAPWPA